MVEMNLAGQFCSFSPSFLPPLHFKKTIHSFSTFYSSKDQRGYNVWMAPSALRRWRGLGDHSARVGQAVTFSQGLC